ncbi:MAG: CHASE3 domain-containing protein, partial [Janthinobacterium lividum]
MFISSENVNVDQDIMKKWTLERLVLGGFGMAVIVLLLLAVIAWHNSSKAVEAQRMVDENHTLVMTLSNLVSNLYQAEFAQRSYVVTGVAKFLATRDEALAAMAQNVSTAQKLTAKAPDRRFEFVQGLLTRRAALFQFYQDLRYLEGMETVTGQFSQELAITDEIRATITKIETETSRLLAAQMQEESLRSSRTRTATAVLLFILPTVLIYIFMQIRRDVALRERAATELAQNEARLKQILD